MLRKSFTAGLDLDNAQRAEHPIMHELRQWIERRLSHRLLVNRPVLVLQGTQVQSGLLWDLSESGFGLSRVSGLVTGAIVSATTHDGDVFEGRVVWIDGGRAGVSMNSQS
ncbi:MAG: PilZ domain-containing protein [Proteobacteria bacterium]|nr:PilZ domain-containing protein [Pseudomonadota bacterium]